jgi:RimJ/RimL family protein N-acetyltransferase
MITIRAMHPDDLDTLYPLWQEQTMLLTRDAAPDYQTWAAVMMTHLADTRMLLYTALDADGLPVGCVIAWLATVGMLPGIAHPTGVIADLILEMHRPHPGAASALVEAVHAGFAAHGVHRVIALSHARAVISQAFWRGRGGVGVLDGFVSSSADAHHPKTP